MKIFLLLPILLSLLNPTSSFARSTISPDYADTNYPEDINNLKNHVVPQDSFNSHTQTIDITNSFDPNSASPSATPVPYNVNEIKKESSPKARTLLKSFDEYTANNFLNPLASIENIVKAFRSLNLNSSTGASNLGQRVLSYKDQRCLASQRLIQAVNTLDPEFKGDILLDSLVEFPDRPPLRLSQLAYLLKDQAIFYDPRLPCNNDSLPTTLLSNPALTSTAKSLFSSKAQNSLLTLDQALTVFSRLPVTSDSDSALQEMDLYEKQNGQMVLTQTFQINQPGAGVFSTVNDKLYQGIRPYNADADEYNYSDSSKKLSANISDSTNNISFIARVVQFFGTVFDKSETYSDSTQITVRNPVQVEEGANNSATSIRHLLPYKTSKSLEDTPGSYKTEGSELPNPGQPAINSLDQLVRNLQPASWQPSFN